MNRLRHALGSLRRNGWGNFLALVAVRIRSYLAVVLPERVRGERLDLISIHTPLAEEQVQRLYELSHDPQVLQWSGARPEPSLADYRERLARERRKPQTHQWLFYISVRGEGIIGRLGLFSVDWNVRPRS